MTDEIGIIGLGYVGLPFALLCAKKGFNVVGIDKKPERIELINKGTCPSRDENIKKDFDEYGSKIEASADFSAIKDCKIIAVCVPTPLDEKRNPDLSFVESACKEISKNITKDTLVIIESTIFPGVCRNIIKPILEESGMKVGSDIFLAYCPERIDPGNKQWNTENIPRVIGAITEEGLKRGKEFYSSTLTSKITATSSIEIVEASKLIENTFRDVNIAFVNELAKLFDKADLDIMEAIEAASTKPFGFMAFKPGCGVGGHCIPIDPYYLIEFGKKLGFENQVVSTAREINNSMPLYTIEAIKEGIEKIGKDITKEPIGILGVTYKGDVEDYRESPAMKIINQLKEIGANLKVFDPFVPSVSNTTLEDALDSECVVFLAEHKIFKELDIKKYPKIKVIIDGKNFLNKKEIGDKTYRGIGHR